MDWWYQCTFTDFCGTITWSEMKREGHPFIDSYYSSSRVNYLIEFSNILIIIIWHIKSQPNINSKYKYGQEIVWIWVWILTICAMNVFNNKMKYSNKIICNQIEILWSIGFVEPIDNHDHELDLRLILDKIIGSMTLKVTLISVHTVSDHHITKVYIGRQWESLKFQRSININIIFIVVVVVVIVSMNMICLMPIRWPMFPTYNNRHQMLTGQFNSSTNVNMCVPLCRVVFSNRLLSIDSYCCHDWSLICTFLIFLSLSPSHLVKFAFIIENNLTVINRCGEFYICWALSVCLHIIGIWRLEFLIKIM